MKTLPFQPHRVSKIQPLGETILVVDMKFDERITSSGVILLNDDTKLAGIRPRWCKVYEVGPEQKYIEPGQYILVSHGRWTRGIKIEDDEGPKTIRRVDPKEILMVSDEPVEDETMSDKVI